jgi:hypothetical protein
MKPTNILLLLMLSLFLNTSCKTSKITSPKDDYVIVGWGGGIAALARYYIIENGQLRKDTTHSTLVSVPEDNSKFQFDYVQPDSMYQKVANLRASIPDELLQNNNATYGESWPDGGYREVRTKINDVAYRWHFEIDQSKSSAAVQAFYKRLEPLN